MIDRNVLTSQLLLNWLARILFFTSLASLLPITTYTEAIGGTESQVGLVMSAFAVGVLLFRPLVGKAVDGFGRKIVLIAGVVVFIISPLIYIKITSVHALLPVRLFHGLGLAAFGTASITLITDAAPANSRTEVISYTDMVNTIAFAAGPTMGFFIVGKWGYPTLFSFASATAGICFILSLFLHETRVITPQKDRTNYFQAIKQRKILVAASIILLVGLVHGGVMFFIPTFLTKITINQGLFFTVYGLTALMIRGVVGPITNRIGRGPLLVSSLLLLSGGVFMLSQISHSGLVLVSAAVYGLGFGSHQPTLTALVADHTVEETRGKIFSFYYGGFDLGVSAAGFVLGKVAEIYGVENMFILCSVITLTATLIFATMMESTLPASLRHAFVVIKPGKSCDICDQYLEVPSEQAEAYFKEK